MCLNTDTNKANISVNSDNDDTNTDTDVNDSSSKRLMFICNDCGDIFTDKYLLIEHKKYHDEVKRSTGLVSDERSSHQRATLNHFECKICQQNFSHKHLLNVHLQIHTGEKPFECQICTLRCSQMSDLTKHLRIHTGEKPFECEICKVRFTRKHQLNIHLRTHNGEKPFECEICKIRFRQKGNLQIHLRKHVDAKPYECEVCKVRFNHRTNLKKHLTKHSQDKPFECEICKNRFKTKDNLKKHLRKHTQEKSFECKIGFNEKNHLMKQLRTRSDSSEAVSSVPPTAAVDQPADPPKTMFSRQSHTDEGKDDHVNYGSEDDFESDVETDDEGAPFVPSFFPRADLIHFFEDDHCDEDIPSEQTNDSATSVDETLDHRPLDLFHFDWKDFPSYPILAVERREVFHTDKVGPTAEFSSPYDAFVAIWTPEFMREIAEQTNRYAQQTAERKIREGTLKPTSRLVHWEDTNVDELYVFFALLLETGITIIATMSDYWTKNQFTNAMFTKYMSYRRFLLISNCLHFVDNAAKLPHELTPTQAKVSKISPVIEHLNKRFQALYNLNRNISIDESLTQWKGRLAFKQFIKNKVVGEGIKTLELCEAQTGYLWRFQVFLGRDKDIMKEISPVSGVSAIELDLLKDLEYKGHTVWMDSFYNSPAVARVLKSIGFDCVGTLRTNRQYVPSKIKTLQKSDMEIGQISGCTSGDIDIVMWRDTNRVAMISTYHGPAVYTANGKTKPTVVHDYKVCMAGVDKKDQIISAYPIERKRTRVWYKKFFRRLLNASVLNAFILYRDSVNIESKKRIKQRDFRKTLVSQLLEKHINNPILTTEKTELPTDKLMRPRLSQEVLKHFPREYGFVPNSTSKKERIRRSCVVCHKRQYTYCEACNVALCIYKCSRIYHQ